MTSFLSYLNPIPSFPSYSGPYHVGTIDVEVPIVELSSPSPSPDSSISTISFRIFYPCEPPTKKSPHVHWIPDPQHQYVAAFAGFLGASTRLSNLIAYLPRLIYHTTIPASRNARLLPPVTKTKRWPVMVFSHGLGGSRNGYSHITGSLASHGMVVVAPEHRDGSVPVSYIGGPAGQAVYYKSIAHTPTREVEEARDQQLKIRLWELGLVHEALLKVDRGEAVSNIVADAQRTSASTDINGLSTFADTLDIHTPGKVSWGGHSMGAATVVQFVKSVFYRPSKCTPPSYRSLYTPNEDSAIVREITLSSPVSLLDPWALPLRSAATHWLWDKPMPCYYADGPGGSNLLIVLSEAFFRWRGNLEPVKRAVSEDPSQEHSFIKKQKTPPYIFYPLTSAHLSQSDFGVLFPWLTKRAFKAEEPERTLRLNVRAILEVLRQNGQELADTSDIDMEEQDSSLSQKHKNGSIRPEHKDPSARKIGSENTIIGQDGKILAKDGSVRGWIALDVDNEGKPDEATNQKTHSHAQPGEAVFDGEMMKG